MRTLLLRGIILTFIILLFALALTACGGSKAGTGSTPLLRTQSADENLNGKTILARSDKPVSVPGAFPTEGGVPMLVHLFDAGSYDPDGEIVKWEWNFGDQEDDKGGWHDYTETRGDAWHTYTHPGTIVAHLRVTDNDGNKDVAFVKIKLRHDLNAPPVAVANATPREGTAPLAVSFSAQGSYDPDGIIVKYEWDFGDGSGWHDFTSSSGSADFTYTTAGTYTATLRVTDDDGAMSTNSVEITVWPAPNQRGDWWMFGREPTHRRQSPFVGPQTPNVKWRFQTQGPVACPPAIASDGTLYFGGTDSYIYALNSDGSLKWTYPTGAGVESGPAITTDGRIVIGSYDGYVYCLNPNGTLNWRYPTGGGVESSAAIAEDGTIYIGSADFYLYALYPNGARKWRFYASGVVSSSPAIGADGTVYVCSHGASSLFAVNPDGTEKWRFRAHSYTFSSPAIAEDGTIYFTSYDGNLYAINPDGSLKWSFYTGNLGVMGASVGSDGTVYPGTYNWWNTNNSALFAIYPNGSLKWRYECGERVSTCPTLGADGTVYFGGRDYYYVYALYPDGTLKWKYQTGRDIWWSPVLAEDGTLYVGSADGYMYAFADGAPPPPPGNISTVDGGDDEDAGRSISLAFGPDGYPSISYHTWSPTYDLKYAHWNGSAWVIDIVEDLLTNGYADGGTSLAFDSFGVPTVSYVHHIVPQGFNGKLWFARKLSGTWTRSQVPDYDAVGQHSSLKYDSSGNPVIAYHQFISFSGGVKLARWNGTNWVIQHVDSNPGEVGGVYVSMALDSADNPHISYGAGSGNYGGGQLRYAHWNGSQWVIQVVDTGIGARWPLQSIFTSIALDSTEHPLIAYRDAIAQDLKFASFDGTSWTRETVESDGDTGWHCSLALNSANVPFVGYQKLSAQTVNLAVKDAGWVISVIESGLGTATFEDTYTSLALDPEGNPAIAYRHGGTKSLKFAWLR